MICSKKVIEKLQEEFGAKMYRYDNVLLTGTHTHHAQGGYFQYAAYQISLYGYEKENADALANGIVQVNTYICTQSDPLNCRPLGFRQLNDKTN